MTDSETFKHVVLTARGFLELKELLQSVGAGDHDADAWRTEVEFKLTDDLHAGNTLEVELTGLRYASGHTVFFSPHAARDIEIIRERMD